MGRSSSRSLWTAKVLGKPLTRGTADADIKKLTQKKSYEGQVLGIDPSLRGTGLAILSFKKNIKHPVLDFSKTLKLKPYLSSSECLGQIALMVNTILKEFDITHAAIEKTIHVQNFQVAQIMGAARGAAIGAIASHGIPVFEYAPLRIKQSVVGFGRASKEQVANTIMNLLNHTIPLAHDEADAAGVAFCHAMTYTD